MSERNVHPAGRPEAELLAAARAGDTAAFTELVRLLEPRVAATVVGMIGPGPEAEDIGQETFVRFYRALPRFRGESAVASYVVRIAINLCRDARRRRRRRKEIFVPENDGQAERAAAPPAGAETLAERDLVQRALQRLDPDHRAVIVLRLLDGFSTRETAAILGLPEGTVTSRLARGQMKLRDILQPLCKEVP